MGAAARDRPGGWCDVTWAVVLAAFVTAVLPWLARRSAGRLPRTAGGGSGGGGRSRSVPGALSDAGPPARGDRPARWLSSLRSPGGPAEAEPALLLDLVAVALAAGAPVPTALAAVGAAWPGATGEALARAARALTLGAPWDVAWTGAGGGARVLAEALGPSWLTGASPVPLLRSAADRVRSRRRAEARAAAGRLGVQLVVPLALCYLPAFVLVGLVPVVVSLAGGLLG